MTTRFKRMGMLYAGIAALSTLAFTPAQLPVHKAPQTISEKVFRWNGARRETVKQRKRRERRLRNVTGWRANLLERIRVRKQFASRVQDMINHMTNWQNHQWLRAGGIRDYDNVLKYATLCRRR